MRKLLVFVSIFVVLGTILLSSCKVVILGVGRYTPPGSGGGGGGKVFPTIYFDPPIIIPTSPPDPDDPGRGNKWMYHCRYWECGVGDPGAPPDPYLCSPEAETVPVGSCWREAVLENTNIREQCFYNHEVFRGYNCFEGADLCQAFCDAWPTGAIPTDAPDGGNQVVYCKPGCRTCEVFRDAYGGYGSLQACRNMFYALSKLLAQGPGSRRLWCQDYYCQPRCGVILTRYRECMASTPTMCSGIYTDWKTCANDCTDSCMTDFSLDNPPAYLYNAWMSGDTCMVTQKGKTMCAYMCDPKNLGPAPGCSGGYEVPAPAPTSVPNYWYCAGGDGCIGKYDFLPPECMKDCGTDICLIDPDCMARKVFTDRTTCMGGCPPCPNPCVCSANTCTNETCTDDCGTTCMGTKECGLTIVDPPLIEVGNGGTTMPGDASGRYQICDQGFWNVADPVNAPNKAYFKVTISDPEGAQNIEAIAIGFNHQDAGGSTIDDCIVSVFNLSVGNGISNIEGVGKTNVFVVPTTELFGSLVGRTERSMTFEVNYLPGFPSNLNYVWINAMDKNGKVIPWTNTSKQFKFWDCKVDYSGSVFDDSGVVDRCFNGYTEKVTSELSKLTLANTDVRAVGDSVAAAIDPTTKCDFESTLSNELIWGKTYKATLEGLDAGTGTFEARIIDKNIGETTCFTGGVDNIKTVTAKLYVIDPYVTAPPEIQLDFSVIQNADAWFQIKGGGIRTQGDINNQVPAGEKIIEGSSVGSNDDSWILAGKSISIRESGDYLTRNGWKVENGNTTNRINNIIGTKYSYEYFYNEYMTKNGIGMTETSWNNILSAGGTGVVFVNGNLDIGSSNTVALGKYLMVVVKGKVTIAPEVTRLDGIIIANGDIGDSGENADALTINGMIYSGGNISFVRSFVDHSVNNSSPATIIKYRPNLIFNMPSKVFKILSDWRQGQ